MAEQKTLLITGASSGIGRSTAFLFQREGWNVVATMRAPERETELHKLSNVLVERLDTTDSGSITNAIEATIKTFGRLDVLVNNAGYGVYGPLEAISVEKIQRQFQTNVLGMLEVTKAALPHFRKQRSGVVINLSSIGGKMTFPLGTLYHGTKFAIEGMTEALSFEAAEIGVQVKLVEPGAVKTNFGGSSFDFANDESLTEYRGVVHKLLENYAPLAAQASEPELVADVIFQAATDGTDRLRYIAGKDAEEILAKRKREDDGTFLGDIRSLFQLSR